MVMHYREPGKSSFLVAIGSFRVADERACKSMSKACLRHGT